MIEVQRNLETEKLDLIASTLTEEQLNDPTICARELRSLKSDLMQTQRVYKQKAQEAAKMDLAIKYLQEKMLALVPEGFTSQEPDIYYSVQEYNDFDVVDEGLVPEDLKICRAVTQINRPLIKSILKTDMTIPGVRRCKKLKVIVK